MIQFGTWFGNDPYLIYGIQLLPLTPISEERDDLEWAMEMYDPLAESCTSGCVSDGWSVNVLAILATVGHKDLAVERTRELASRVFKNPGGNGHSRSNTLWYISTRPDVDEAHPLQGSYPEVSKLTCFRPFSCKDDVLDSSAGEYPCGDRIHWLMNNQGKSEWDACIQIAVTEFPAECGRCNPMGG
jgi:hypothetical protein